MTRRLFLGGAASTAVVVSKEMSYSDQQGVSLCWSGWRTSPSNNRLVAWWTAHFRSPLKHPSSSFPHGYSHFCAMVTSKYAHEAPIVAGYFPGTEFNCVNSICLEDYPEALRWFPQEDERQQYWDAVFAAEKKSAFDALWKHIGELEIV